MVKPLLDQLRAKVESASGLPATTKAELLKLVAELESQSARPGSGANPHGVDRLVAAVEGLEASHPEITEVANRVATMLGNLGI